MIRGNDGEEGEVVLQGDDGEQGGHGNLLGGKGQSLTLYYLERINGEWAWGLYGLEKVMGIRCCGLVLVILDIRVLVVDPVWLLSPRTNFVILETLRVKSCHFSKIIPKDYLWHF